MGCCWSSDCFDKSDDAYSSRPRDVNQHVESPTPVYPQLRVYRPAVSITDVSVVARQRSRELSQTRQQVADELLRARITDSRPRTETRLSNKKPPSTTRTTLRTHVNDKTSNLRPLFGEFRCSSCRRTWKSFRTWKNCYQMCKKCKQPTYPIKQRELLPSDVSEDKEHPHPKELCQMCQQMGKYCNSKRS